MPKHPVLNKLVKLAADQKGRFLFRGQNRRYPTVTPTLHRCSGDLRGQAYTILRRLLGQTTNQLQISKNRGLISSTSEEVIALMQHLGWPTPYVDLTEDPEVAFFFACDGHNSFNGAAEIIVLDRQSLPSDTMLLPHDRILDPEYNLRWSRQKGYALRVPGWPGLKDAEHVDILRMHCCITYPFCPNEKNLEWANSKHGFFYKIDREISDQARFLVQEIAKICDFSQLEPELDSFPR